MDQDIENYKQWCDDLRTKIARLTQENLRLLAEITKTGKDIVRLKMALLHPDSQEALDFRVEQMNDHKMTLSELAGHK